MEKLTAEIIGGEESFEVRAVETRDTPTGFRISFAEASEQLANAISIYDEGMGKLFSRELAIKHCGKENGTFCTNGQMGEDTLFEEGSVIFRQDSIGVAPGFPVFAKIDYSDDGRKVGLEGGILRFFSPFYCYGCCSIFFLCPGQQ